MIVSLVAAVPGRDQYGKSARGSKGDRRMCDCRCALERAVDRTGYDAAIADAHGRVSGVSGDPARLGHRGMILCDTVSLRPSRRIRGKLCLALCPEIDVEFEALSVRRWTHPAAAVVP